MNVMLVKTRIKSLIFMTLIVSILGCQQNGKSYKERVEVSAVDINDDFESVGNNEQTALKSDMSVNEIPQHLKIIKSATARYKVENVKVATRNIKKIAGRYNAYISDLRYTNDLYKKENRFTIKIPQQYFDSMMDSIGYIVDFVEYENITTKDVTEEYVDIQTRLNTKLEVKSRYETIMRNNAKTIDEILATEEKLRIIQEEIESAQGRLKYLSNKVSYSTIQIDLYETVAYTEEPESYSKTFLSKSKEGLSFGWTAIEGLVVALMYVWPLIILGVIAFLLIRKRLRKRKAA
jgi:hypothetical protein